MWNWLKILHKIKILSALVQYFKLKKENIVFHTMDKMTKKNHQGNQKPKNKK